MSPQSYVVWHRINQLCAAHLSATQPTNRDSRMLPTQTLRMIAATIIAAIDEEPLPAKIKFLDARVKDIQITDGKLLLIIVPDEDDEEDD